MSKDYCEILLEAIDTIQQKALMDVTGHAGRTEVNVDPETLLIETDPFAAMLQQEKMSISNSIILNGNTATNTFEWVISNQSKYDLCGLACEITATNITTIEKDQGYGVQLTMQASNKCYIVQLDSSEMLGNPSTFVSMLQKKAFDLADVGNISSIGVKFYNNTSETIIFNNVNIIIGYNLETFDKDDEPLIIYGEDAELKYRTNEYGEIVEGGSEVLCARWIYQDEEVYRGVTLNNPDDLPAGTDIRWYRYSEASPEGDEYGGAYWVYQPLTSEEEEQGYSKFRRHFSDFDPQADTEQFKAVIVQGSPATSTFLVFTSKIITIENIKEAEVEALTSRRVNLLDGTGGIYPYYSYDQMIIENYAFQALVERTATLSYQSIYKPTELLERIQSVEWKLPEGHFYFAENYGDVVSDEEGNACVIKTVSSNTELTDEKKLNELFTCKYTISENRNPNFIADKIQCIVTLDHNKPYLFEKEAFLTIPGSGGTDNSVVVRLVDDIGRRHAGIMAGEKLYLRVNVYDVDGNDITSSVSISQEPLGWTTQLDTCKPVEGVNGLFSIKAADKVSTPIGLKFTINLITIAQKENTEKAEGENTETSTQRQLNIIEYVVLPITTSKIYGYQGPTTFLYDSSGVLCAGQGAAVKLLNRVTRADVKISSINSNVMYVAAPELAETITENDESVSPKLWWPTLSEGNMLTPNPYYDQACDIEKGCFYIVINDGDWVQPITIAQRRYFSRIINEWDGSLKIDEDGNYILAASYVAGKKNDDNTFTGAILGELGKISDEESAQDEKEIGLFGYDNGSQSFGFRANGTAFLGKSGGGRIEFDGTKGTIKSANFDGEISEETEPESGRVVQEITNKGTGGTYLDLATGLLITNDGHFRGHIEATSGKIGDITINPPPEGETEGSVTIPELENIKINDNGRNLILNSGVEVVSEKNAVVEYDLSNSLIDDVDYTLSLSVTTGKSVERLYFYNTAVESGAWQELTSLLAKNLNKQTVSTTIKGKKGQTKQLWIYRQPYDIEDEDNDGDVDEGRVTIHWIKIERGNRASGWTPAPEDLENKITEQQKYIDAIASDLQDQIDGTITSWFENRKPHPHRYYDENNKAAISTDNPNKPASGWINDDVGKDRPYEQIKHEGDLYYDESTGYCYRWVYVNEGEGEDKINQHAWIRITDSDITKALEQAANAKATADKKSTTFITKNGEPPTPPYQYGDVWVKADGDGNGKILLYCKTNRESGSGVIDDWVAAADYLANEDFIAFKNDYANFTNSIQSQVDNKADTYYQATDPSTEWTTLEEQEKHIGDLWRCTAEIKDDSNNVIRKANSEWVWIQEKTINNYEFDVIIYKMPNQDTTNYINWNKERFYSSDQLEGTSKIFNFYYYYNNQWNEVKKVYCSTFVRELILKEMGSQDKKYYVEAVDCYWYYNNGNDTWYINGPINVKMYDWHHMEIPDNIFDAYDGKSSVYVSEPSNYKANDIWILSEETTVNGVTYKEGTLLTSSRSSVIYNAEHWTERVKYSAEIDALADELNGFTADYSEQISSIQIQVDGKAETWYQPIDPSVNWGTLNEKEKHIGDLWHCTAEIKDGNVVLRDKNSEWIWRACAVAGPTSESKIIDKIIYEVPEQNSYENWNVNYLYYGIGPASDYKRYYYYSNKSYNYNSNNSTVTVTDNDTYEWRTAGNAWEGESINALIAVGKANTETVYYVEDTQRYWAYDGSMWVYDSTDYTLSYEWFEMSVPDEVFDKIDGKSSIFAQSTPPQSFKKNDTWILTAETYTINQITYKKGTMLTATANSDETGATWTETVKYTDDTVANALGTQKRNFVLNSGTIRTITSNPTYIDYTPSIPLVKGRKYTITINTTPGPTIKQISLFLSGHKYRQYYLLVEGGQSQRISATFDADYKDENTPSTNTSYEAKIRLYHDPKSGQSLTDTIIHWIKIEEGDTFTGWVAAPEDMANIDSRLTTLDGSVTNGTGIFLTGLENALTEANAKKYAFSTSSVLIWDKPTSEGGTGNKIFSAEVLYKRKTDGTYDLDAYGNKQFAGGAVYLAGWTVTENQLSYGTLGSAGSFGIYPKGTNSVTNAFTLDSGDNWVLTAGRTFGITANGKLYANEGQISNLYIGSYGLYGKYSNSSYSGFRMSTGGNNYKALFVNGSDNVGTNATFYVTNAGLLHAAKIEVVGGTISIGGESDSPNFKVESNGDVTLNGNITWGASASPTQVLYNFNGNVSKPSGLYKDFIEGTNGWYKSLGYRKYASYTYDGGKTWTDVVKIIGDDASAGMTDAERQSFNNLVQSLGITSLSANSIVSPKIGGGYLAILKNINGKSSGVVIDPLGGYDNTNQPIFKVLSNDKQVMGIGKDGNAMFEGTITATGGSIAGWSITNNNSFSSITSGTLGTNGFHMYSRGNAMGKYFGASSAQAWALGIGESFGVTPNGELYAKNAKIAGQITATNGSIAGFQFNKIKFNGGDNGEQETFYANMSDTGSSYYYPNLKSFFICPGGAKLVSPFELMPNTIEETWVIGVGKNFGVTTEGKLYARQANFSGEVQINKGNIGGFNIGSKQITQGKTFMLNSADTMILYENRQETNLGYPRILAGTNFTYNEATTVSCNAFQTNTRATEDVGSTFVGTYSPSLPTGYIITEIMTDNVVIKYRQSSTEGYNTTVPSDNYTLKTDILNGNEIQVTIYFQADIGTKFWYQCQISGLQYKRNTSGSTYPFIVFSNGYCKITQGLLGNRWRVEGTRGLLEATFTEGDTTYGVGFDPKSLGSSATRVLAIGKFNGEGVNASWDDAKFQVRGDGTLVIRSPNGTKYAINDDGTWSEW